MSMSAATSEAATVPEVSRRFGPWSRELRSFLELFAIVGLAFAQPLFDLLANNAELFVSRRTTGSQLVAFAAIVVLVPPALLWVAEVAVGVVVPPARRWVHVGFVGIAAGVAVEELVKEQTDLGRVALIACGLLAAAAFAVLVARFEPVRTWLRYLAVAPVLFAFLFLWSSPVTTVVFDRGGVRAAEAEVGNPKRVVLVVLDELPVESLLDGTGQVDETLFPSFAAMSRQSTWYRNSRSVAPFTLAAVPAVLTGDYPKGDPSKPAVAANYPRNVFTLLGGTYDVNAHESLTVLCPAGVCDDARHVGQFHGGTRGLLVDAFDLWRRFASPDRTESAIDLDPGQLALDADPMRTGRRFVRSLTPADRPRLDMLHVLLPHWPWHYVGSGQSYGYGDQTVPAGLANDAWVSDWAALSARQRHLLQLQATDALLGSITQRLVDIGAWDDSLVVVTADHGVGFVGGDPARGVSAENAPQVVWTPLFVKYPGQRIGVVDDRPARAVDVVPTIADVVDAEPGWDLGGRSLLRTARHDGEFGVFSWELDRLPAKDGYVTVDGPAGFAKVLSRRASDATGDPELRLYRVGPYADLIGRSAAPLVGSGDAPAGTLDHPEHFAAVHEGAPLAPWLYASGVLASPRVDVPLAVAANGTIVGLSATVATSPGAAATSWWASIAPQLLRDGANTMLLYEIRGDPSAPRLVPVRLATG